MINLVVIKGRLGKDPEVKFFNDLAKATFSVATGKKWKDKNSGEMKEKTTWHNIQAWRRLGELCGEFLRKGDEVTIVGEIETHKYEDKDGTERVFTSINATQIDFPTKKSRSESSAPQNTEAPDEFIPDDDVPF